MKTTPTITVCDIEIAVAEMLGWRQNLIVPNVSYGLGLNWEADLVVVRRSGFATEVEIKVTAADLAQDQKKRKWLLYNYKPVFKYHYYAVPTLLVPKVWRRESGIIEVTWVQDALRAKIVRPARLTGAQKLSPERLQKLMELGCMRIWSLKIALLRKARSSCGPWFCPPGSSSPRL